MFFRPFRFIWPNGIFVLASLLLITAKLSGQTTQTIESETRTLQFDLKDDKTRWFAFHTYAQLWTRLNDNNIYRRAAHRWTFWMPMQNIPFRDRYPLVREKRLGRDFQDTPPPILQNCFPTILYCSPCQRMTKPTILFES